MAKINMVRSPEILNRIKARGINENLFHLGMLLDSGISLPEALKDLSDFTGNSRLKNASLRAASMLAAGNPPSDVFSVDQMRVFTGFARFILASPLSDLIKGRLLAYWKRKGKSYGEISKSLFYCIQSLLIGLMTCMTLFIFVLPQFREIMYGLKLSPEPHSFNFSYWFIELLGSSDMSGLVVTGLLFSAGIAFMVFAGQKIFKTSEIVEEVNLFYLLNAVDFHDRLKTLEIMAVSHNFPRSFNRLKTFAVTLREEGDVNQACKKAGLDQFLSWFLSLAFTEGSDTRIIAQGALLLETRYQCSIEKTTRIAEIFSVAGQGIIFGLVAIVVFQLMNQILLGVIA